jgi:DNA polymerase-3 subunit gamma/tau
MMATTEPENIPQTIRSRCQHFSFHAVKFDDILAQLRMIAGHEQVTAEDDALALLAEAGDGSMRDALSIMDQAIASAPVESGRPVLAADQIRDLMGSLPNAVFEHLLEAVAAGNSAELMAQLNVRLNAGHSPSSLARQLVRYLRNTLMARLGGEQTELLQISGDERARAARTALLFTEEEITRNLQIVLHTFDDLNYRQEQRFHLELGLLKLIHAQRLIPLEELLSGVSPSSSARPATSPAPSRQVSAPASVAASSRPASPTSPRPIAAPSEPAAPSISPFGPSSGGWSSGPRQSADATSIATIDRPAASMAAVPAAPEAAASPFSGATPFPAAASPTLGYSNVTSITEGALAKAPEADSQPGEAHSLEFIRHAVGTALVEAGHVSAAQLLGVANWNLDGASLRVEVPGIGKKMLALTINANTEKLIRQQLQRLGAPARFLIVPGEGSAVAQAPAAPISGSIQEAALSNPIVQRAKELFNAEILSVIDLRQKT